MFDLCNVQKGAREKSKIELDFRHTFFEKEFQSVFGILEAIQAEIPDIMTSFKSEHIKFVWKAITVNLWILWQYLSRVGNYQYLDLS